MYGITNIKFNLKYIQKFSSYLTDNKTPLQYKD
jgi:hypothetical protein